MMTNLFSIFDPSTSFFFSMNWLALIFFIFLLPLKKWLLFNRLILSITTLMKYIFEEFKPIFKKMNFLLLTSLTYFFLIMFNNVMGLFPYIFTSTTHMVFTLSLALTAWLSLMFYGWLNNYSNLLAHLIPQGTPYMLMPFMVVIESISNLIRPGTLAIRLTANMIAGHLLMVLLSSALASSQLFFILIFVSQIMLTMLETAVSFIQAYVFSVLVTLYLSEFAN